MSASIFLRHLLSIVSVAAFAATASAQSTGASAPPTPLKIAAGEKAGDRQGGDTIATATPITTIPFTASGTTVGYANDYDVACPYGGSESPDVVYSFTRPQYGTLTIDLCGSDYDTKVYVMSAGGQILDCNDDRYLGGVCGNYTSRIDNLWLPDGETYYLVIDGKNGAAGEYRFEMRRWEPTIPPGPGDTIADAIVIPALPYDAAGATIDYNDDYVSTCFFAGGAPDVVYRYTVAAGVAVLDISMCGSNYDTGLYVYDSALNEIACNDDWCGLQSQLENVGVVAGQVYYIIVDGYYGEAGSYVLSVTAHVPCVLTCPHDSNPPEGEPPLVDDYVDTWNGGCNTTPGYPFQHISGALPGSTIPVGSAVFCGVSGWYLNAGSQFRDTDWFTLTVGYPGVIQVAADAEYASYIFELTGTCAGGVTVVQQAIAGPCSETTMSIPGASGSTKWFWVGPTVFADPDGGANMYDYVVWFSGLQNEILNSVPTTWSALKALYR
jgi:hypothetical protein